MLVSEVIDRINTEISDEEKQELQNVRNSLA